jgi:hypothetical protein
MRRLFENIFREIEASLMKVKAFFKMARRLNKLLMELRLF